MSRTLVPRTSATVWSSPVARVRTTMRGPSERYSTHATYSGETAMSPLPSVSSRRPVSVTAPVARSISPQYFLPPLVYVTRPCADVPVETMGIFASAGRPVTGTGPPSLVCMTRTVSAGVLRSLTNRARPAAPA
ncbi:hypothetical protein STENM327S_05743 [Streptomyces tendae]